MPEDNGPPSGDKRNEGRAAITLKVDYKRLNTFFADYTRNISKGGTFIRTDRPLAIGTEFVFVLSVRAADDADESIKLELTGEVKWIVTVDEATAERPAGMGIQFVFRDDAARAEVEGRVAELMRTSLGSHLADKLLSR